MRKNKLLIVSIVITAAIFVFSIPYGLKIITSSFMTSFIGDNVKIEEVRTNFFSFISIKGIKSEAFSCNSVKVSFDIFDILKSKPHIKEIDVEGVNYLVKDSGQGFSSSDFRMLSKDGNGKSIPSIEKFNINNLTVNASAYGIMSLNVALVKSGVDYYNINVTGKSISQYIKDTILIDGDILLGSDFKKISFDNVSINGKNNKLRINGNILTNRRESMVEAKGFVDMLDATNIINRIFRINIPITGIANIDVCIKDPLGNSITKINGNSKRAQWGSKIPFSFSSGVTIKKGEFVVDSLYVLQDKGELFTKGSFDFNSDFMRIYGSLQSLPIKVNRKKEELKVVGAYVYTGPISKKNKRTFKYDGEFQKTGKSVGNFCIKYSNGNVDITSTGFGGKHRGKGVFDSGFKISGKTEFAAISDVLSLVGINATGKGSVNWDVRFAKDDIALTGKFKVKDILAEKCRFDSLYGNFDFKNNNWNISSLGLYRDSLKFVGNVGKASNHSFVGDGMLSDGNRDSVFVCSVIFDSSCLSVQLKADKIDTKKISEVYKDTIKINGVLSANGTLSKKSGLWEWNGFVDWDNPQYKSIDVDKISCMVHSDNKKIVLDSLIVINDAGESKITGFLPYPWRNDKEINIAAKLNNFPTEIVPFFIHCVDSVKGNIRGDFNFYGSLKNPVFKGNIVIDTLDLNVNPLIPKIALYGTVFNTESGKWNLNGIGKIDTVAVGFVSSGEYDVVKKIDGSIKLDVLSTNGQCFSKFHRYESEKLYVKTDISNFPVYILHNIFKFLRPVNGLVNAKSEWKNNCLYGDLSAVSPSVFMISADSLFAKFRYKSGSIFTDSTVVNSASGSLNVSGVIGVFPKFYYDFSANLDMFPVKIVFGKSLFSGDVNFKGNRDSIFVNSSKLRADETEYYIPYCDQVLKIPTGNSEIINNKWVFNKLNGFVDSSQVSVSGEVNFQLKEWDTHFWGTGDSVKISKKNEYVALARKVDFDIDVNANNSDIGLSLDLLKGRYYRDIPRTLLLQPGHGIYGLNQFDKQQEKKLNIRILGPESLWVDNNLAKLHLGADLTITGSVASPLWQGRVKINEGEIYYLSKELYKPFIVDYGGMVFDKFSAGFNPRIDMEARQVVDIYWEPNQKSADTATVFLSIHGPLKQISSVDLNCPVLDNQISGISTKSKMQKQAQIIAVLLTGVPLNRFSQAGISGIATISGQSMFKYYLQIQAQRHLASLLHLDVVKITGGDIFNLKKDDKPELTMKKSVTSKLDVEYSSKLGETIFRTQGLKLQYKLPKNLILESSANQQSDYGMDLKYIIRF